MTSFEKQVELLQLFKKNIIEFLDGLIEQFEEEGDIIIMRFFFTEQIPIETTMLHFIKFIHPYKDMIKQRDEKFFMERENIFGSSPKEKVVHFKELYKKMEYDDKKTLWTWFDLFISLCDKYIQLSK
jgi:hypothetical protein